MSSTTENAGKVHRYRCPGCAADLLYEPRDGCLTCPYCGRQEQIPASPDQVTERAYEDYLRPHPSQLARLSGNALEVSCSQCGATVTFTPPEVAGECAFCGSKIVAQPRSADPTVAPEGVLPFAVTSEEADRQIVKWIGGLWFAPNALKRLARRESVDGVYLPFWTYDCNTTSHYSGERGEHYYVTETYTETDAQGNQVTKTRQVQHTRWYPASGVVERWFDDVLIPATRSLSPKRLESLEPWDLDQLKIYDPAFLSGYKAQSYQVTLPEGFETAKHRMAGVIRGDVASDIGGDEQRIHRIATAYSGVSFKHLLLPVYVAAYHFKEKIYQVMINARTGEVQGDRPYSVIKIVLFVLFLVAVIAVLTYFFGNR
jgi:DNA-directed RNA polymerase subunit RPC12/RpoP